MSAISWRVREQARKDAAESEARRRATEKSEINFPSLTGTEWGASVITDTSTAKKWVARSVIASTTTPTAAEFKASISSYTPPTIVSRASIARAISESKYGGGDTSTRHEDIHSTCDNSDDGWVEVRGKSYTGATKHTESSHFTDYEYNHYTDDGDFMGEEDSRNS